ncbi:MAG TPA: ATP synthase subunit I [Brevefilum fermentans]|jgi:hypothetical protein|uniref:Uncharacterized protein n=1 Tax=Candidatus Brevifilum fermentans TaxID=1986204 RepID=A0A1Y6K4C8_9CHLR|nr:ATP synthase subunit I [Brevefilum fermentans]MDI9566791.1 ATP synthase subunit I [Chloroflexota bacterium]SMX54531.1 membrane protein of unknown function [Brevefilum fermentans]HQA29133.1 ATP synthase subunit I [Brevefilum fermentans]
MIAFNFIFWTLIGAITGYLYFLSQQWSVNQLDTQKRHRSISLIMVGTILRWLLVGIVFSISVSHSYLALLSVFLSFMLVRLVFLLMWQGWLRFKNPFIRH